MKYIKIRDKTVGDGHPAFIIAEMAWSHDGDFDNARKIITAACKAKADAICMHLTYVPDYITKDYHVLKDGASKAVDTKSLYNFLDENNLSDDEWSALIAYAHEIGLCVVVMCNDLRSLDFALEKNVDAFVLSPASMLEFSMIKRIVETKKPIFIRIGGAYLAEVETIVEYIERTKGNRIALIHGFQSFPTELSEMNLNCIAMLKEKFDVPVGFADHMDAESRLSVVFPAVSISKGANIVEKHLTHDRKMKGLDYESALNPDEFNEMVGIIRDIEKSFGTSIIDSLSEKELQYRNVARKRAVASKDLNVGDDVSYDNFTFKRANQGIYPDEFERSIGKKLTCPVKKDSPLMAENIG